jgi:hypothetical protein
MTLNKDSLNAHISTYNNLFINEIIEIIKDDRYWLDKLRLKEADIKLYESISEMIKTKLNNPENKESIDLVLKYAIGDYLLEDDKLPLIKHEVSVDSHWHRSALFVFKCSELYFCYYYGTKIKTLITEDPLAFCCKTIKSIIECYEMENENLNNEWFQDSESTNNLQLNFNYSTHYS